MIDVVSFAGQNYPAFQAAGNAAQFAIPFARHVCKGRGVDVGCGRQEWAFPGAIPIDLTLGTGTATNFEPYDLDYVFSSHCLEHLEDWVDALDYWREKLRLGGTLFLYLPDYSQVYWRPWNNRKHRSVFTPDVIRDYLVDRKFKPVFVSGIDLNNSFVAMGDRT